MGCGVAAESPAYEAAAESLALWLGERGGSLAEGYGLRLGVEGLAVVDPEGRRVRADWTGMDVRSGPGRSLKAPLFRAVASRGRSLRGLRVLDATAGWGEDLLLLVAAGCEVVACERDPVVAQLLADGIRRAEAAGIVEGLASRCSLAWGDSGMLMADEGEVAWLYGDGLGRGLAGAEVVVMDPMFATERKAGERQAMKTLRVLAGEGDAAADERLLRAAMGLEGVRRVAVKRARRAGVVGGLAPHHSVEGRGFRFDVYLGGD
ncbi:class I SAM-dependent methyltransferase [Mucisphaera sp.]|uniref:class I SAM-dependent methyltransferase n=1 Tax=Mucisphaera sp. TaxID=2913024 RepID=UPI003D0C9CE8